VRKEFEALLMSLEMKFLRPIALLNYIVYANKDINKNSWQKGHAKFLIRWKFVRAEY